MIQNRLFSISIVFSVIVLAAGCGTVNHHQKDLSSTQEREMTVGIVQKEIRKGMSQADVAAALGSPNIVTRDSEEKDTWIYDKIAAESSYSSSSANIGGGGVPGSSLILGFFRHDAGASSTSQRTLTVIIKFDKRNSVESFSYHASKF